ncbi:MAG: Nif3-like dinuclear metal center hexameric protein [Desulfobacteraceae bacterium]|nr:Nif3-like dinuclear metal center hexameric protein [Desulfobacteraceae bacterium]
MQLTVKKIIDIIDAFAPFDLAEDWDNSGLQVGSLGWTIQKIMISLDVSMDVMEAAKAWGADLVLTHHPLQMKSEKSIDFAKMPGSAIALAAREKISILSVHTNLDKTINGLNDYFAKIIGVNCDEPLHGNTSQSIQSHDNNLQGIGRIGYLDYALSLQDLIAQIKKRLGLEFLRVTGDLNLQVKKIALCTGSGGSLIDSFLESSADVYITGDIKYHEARQVEIRHKGLIDVGHFASEIIVVDLLESCLAQTLSSSGYNIKIKGFKEEQDPFKTV